MVLNTKKGKGFPCSLPSVGPGADPGVQAVSPQVTIRHPPGGRLPLLSARPEATFTAAEHHRPLAGTELYCLVIEAHRCIQLAKGCYAALPRVGFDPTTCWSQVQCSTRWTQTKLKSQTKHWIVPSIDRWPSAHSRSHRWVRNMSCSVQCFCLMQWPHERWCHLACTESTWHRGGSDLPANKLITSVKHGVSQTANKSVDPISPKASEFAATQPFQYWTFCHVLYA